jgi:hypothetical protein
VVGLPEPQKDVVKASWSDFGEQEKIQKEVSPKKTKSQKETKEKFANHVHCFRRCAG